MDKKIQGKDKFVNTDIITKVDGVVEKFLVVPENKGLVDIKFFNIFVYIFLGGFYRLFFKCFVPTYKFNIKKRVTK